MFVRGLFILTFLFLGTSAFAQFTMEGYLSNAISSEELQYFKERQEFVAENGFKSPILREVEFRARVRNFGEGFNDYRLRFSPLNPLEKKANKNFSEALSKQLQAEYQMNLEKVLESRYQLMIEHYSLTEKYNVLKEVEYFYQRTLATLQNNSSGSDLKDYIALDKAHMKASIELEEIAHDLRSIERTIQFTYIFSESIGWEGVELIDVEVIKNSSDSTNTTLDNNLYLKNEVGKEVVASMEYNIERQEAFRNLGYVQAEYRHDDDMTFGENMGMQVAVNIPIVNPDKPDLQRRKLDLIEDGQELEEEKREMEQYMSLLYSDLEFQLAQHDLVRAKLSRYENQNFTSTDPGKALELLVELSEFKSELQLMKIALKADILNSYISLLSLEGKLSSQPYINYLSKGQYSFEMKE